MLLTVALAMAQGCGMHQRLVYDDLDRYSQYAAETHYGDVATIAYEGPLTGLPPLTVRQDGTPPYYDLTLPEAIQIALRNSRVLDDFGGAVLRGPGAVQTINTIFDPAIVETDPRFGPAAALAAFDAEFFNSARFEKNDRAINNVFFGGGTRLLEQDLMVWQSELRKRSATGTQYFLRQNTEYDANNSPGNRFPSAWNVNWEMQFRHPLLQGGGLDYNRIAGPGAPPGVYNGVVVARINANVELADFQAALRNLVSDVENAYWDLYYAYRDLDAKIDARDATLATWRMTLARAQAGRRGGEEEKQNQALEQYYRFQAEVQNALAGRPGEGTRNGNGATGGVFRGPAGVQAAERRLRLVLGLPATDGRLMRPIEEPILAPVIFAWDEIAIESLYRREELQQQREIIRRGEMELLAARNFLLPQLDAFGLYRWRGFGHDLLAYGRDGREPFDNAYMNLTSGDFQEWQAGFEMTLPIGFRLGNLAVRNAQLRLVRERAVLEEQQRQILHDLSAQVAEVERAFVVAQTAFNRRAAAKRELAVYRGKEEQGLDVDIDQILEVHRRIAEADLELHRSLVEYVLAVKNVHLEKGSLLDYSGVQLAEHRFPDAASPAPHRVSPRELLNYIFDRTPPDGEAVEPPAGRRDGGAAPAPYGEPPPEEIHLPLPQARHPLPLAPPHAEERPPWELAAESDVQFAGFSDAEDATAAMLPGGRIVGPRLRASARTALENADRAGGASLTRTSARHEPLPAGFQRLPATEATD